MAYYLHIERPGDDPDSEPTPIPLAEWRAAVEGTKGVRLFAAQAHTAANSKTGEIISVRANVGDVEVYFADDNRWHAAIYWHEGSAAIPARRLQPGDTSHPVWVAAVGLASYLGAAIRGEEGEVYDLQTGKATRALPPR
jgi:hypothetical protein